jgi:hypothetical protein
VTFDQTQTRSEHRLRLGQVSQTDWFPDPLVLQVVTTPAAPQPAAIVSTETKHLTERVSLRGPLTTSGTFLRSMGRQGNGAGEFQQPMGVAVAQDQVFVTDFTRHRVQVFDLDGKYLRGWGTEGQAAGS